MTNGYGRSTGGFGMERDEAAQLIVDTALAHGVTDRRQIAYMLATAQHETRNFDAPEEDFGRSQARRYDYSGGEEYYGRGFVHLTHDYNYLKMDRALGLEGRLVADPSLATDPEIAARALVVGMRDGLYTGKRLDRYINDDSLDYYNARRVVNGIDRREFTIKAAENAEDYAAEWEQRVPSLIEDAKRRGIQVGSVVSAPERERVPNHGQGAQAAFADGMFNLGDRGIGVETLQRQLIQAGYTGKDGQPLKPDGDFGPNTKHAVEELQRAHGLQVDGKAGMHSLRALADELQNGRPVGRFEDASRGVDPLFQSLRGHVQTMDRAMGRTPDEASDRVAAALCAECRANGLTRVDGVVLGQKGGSAQPGEYVFAYSGSSERPSDWVGVKTAEAVQTPVDQSLAKAETLQRQQAREAPQMAQAPQPSNDSPVISMG